MTISELIARLENARKEYGDFNVLVDQLDKYGEYEGLTEHVHVDWDEDWHGVRIGCQE